MCVCGGVGVGVQIIPHICNGYTILRCFIMLFYYVSGIGGFTAFHHFKTLQNVTSLYTLVCPS